MPSAIAYSTDLTEHDRCSANSRLSSHRSSIALTCHSPLPSVSDDRHPQRGKQTVSVRVDLAAIEAVPFRLTRHPDGLATTTRPMRLMSARQPAEVSDDQAAALGKRHAGLSLHRRGRGLAI